jgi:nitroimidazol reductase NimA-like FMN-containing flavoprotein (pyridoxamine 5'-phosphate oxidase superfamily)
MIAYKSIYTDQGATHPTRGEAMKDLTQQEIADVLEKVRDGVLAVTDGKAPYCIPFGFVCIDGTVYISLFPTGRKWGYLQQNPMVCFNVFRWNEDYTEWQSVVVEGAFEQITDLDTIELVVKANMEKIGLDPTKYIEERMAYYRKTADNPKAVKIFRIKAREVRGKKMATTVGT